MDILAQAKRKYAIDIQLHTNTYNDMQLLLRTTSEGKKYFDETGDLWLKANLGEISADKAEKESQRLLKEISNFMKNKGYPFSSPEYEPLCKKCSDKGYIDGKICACLKKYIVEECCSVSNISENMRDNCFEKFDLSLFTDENKSKSENVLHQCENFCDNFADSYENLIFGGKTGSGKTFFATSIAKSLLENGYSVLYKTAFSLMDDITRYTLGEYERSVYDFIFSCDLLIIDDMGTERTTDFAEMQLYNILQERMNSRRSIIITTNLTVGEMKRIYTERIISRIAGGFKWLETQNEDIRLKLKLMKKQNSRVKK